MSLLLHRLAIALAALRGGDIVILVDVYVALIVAVRRTLAQVPAAIRDQVAAELAALGNTE